MGRGTLYALLFAALALHYASRALADGHALAVLVGVGCALCALDALYRKGMAR